ncbi:unnamed protein product [Arctogadus glacialis]
MELLSAAGQVDVTSIWIELNICITSISISQHSPASLSPAFHSIRLSDSRYIWSQLISQLKKQCLFIVLLSGVYTVVQYKPDQRESLSTGFPKPVTSEENGKSHLKERVLLPMTIPCSAVNISSQSILTGLVKLSGSDLVLFHPSLPSPLIF